MEQRICMDKAKMGASRLSGWQSKHFINIYFGLLLLCVCDVCLHAAKYELLTFQDGFQREREMQCASGAWHFSLQYFFHSVSFCFVLFELYIRIYEITIKQSSRCRVELGHCRQWQVLRASLKTMRCTHARTHNGMLNEQHVKYATVCALWLSRCKLCCFSSSRSHSLTHFISLCLSPARRVSNDFTFHISLKL